MTHPLAAPGSSDGGHSGPLQHHSRQQPHTIAFSFEAVRYTVTLTPSMRQRRVLHDISGLNAPVATTGAPPDALGSAPVRGKAMLSILGPSGAGGGLRSYVISSAGTQGYNVQGFIPTGLFFLGNIPLYIPV